MRGRITVVAQWKCKEKRWRKWRTSNTWAQLYKVMESAEEKWRREYRQDGMGGEECQEWSAIGEYQLDWKGRCTRWQWDQQCCMGWRQWHWRKDRRRRWRWQSWRCCDFHEEWQEWTRSGMSTSEGQHRWESLERKHERQDWDGMDTFGGKMMGILGEGCWGWSCQERGNGEGQKGGLWMWWKRTWLRLKWRRRIQLIGETGERKSAVATPDGKSRKKKFLWNKLNQLPFMPNDHSNWTRGRHNPEEDGFNYFIFSNVSLRYMNNYHNCLYFFYANSDLISCTPNFIMSKGWQQITTTAHQATPQIPDIGNLSDVNFQGYGDAGKFIIFHPSFCFSA